MNGFIKKTAASFCLGAGLFTVIGCHHYREHVDACWPERYNAMARQSVRDMHNAQGDKGHLLDHSLWNDDFDGANLRPSGIAKLKYIAGREPRPDLMKLYLQNADIPFDKDTGKFIQEQERLNEGRKQAIHTYLSITTAARQGTIYQIYVHDYNQPTHPADWTVKALENVEKNIKAGTPQTFPMSTSGGGGSSSGGGGGSR